VKRWHIHFTNGLAIECRRRYKPTRLAASFSRLYGSYTIVGGATC